MSKVDNTEPIERIIHQAFHDLADKYDIDVDIIAKIISDYDEMVSKYLEPKAGAELIFGRN